LADFYSDAFTGSNGTALSAHTADVGGGYSVDGSFAGDFLLVGDGTIRRNNTGFELVTKSAVVPPSPNYLVECVVTLLSAVNRAGFAVRYIDASNFLRWEYDNADGKYHIIERVTGGDNDLGNIADALGSPETISLSIVGQQATLKKAGVAIIGPVTVNSALNLAGSLGPWARGTLSDDVTGVHLSAARAAIVVPAFTYPQLERFHSRGVLRGVVGVH